MSSVKDAHNQAMDAAFFADRERRRGNGERAAELFQQALEWELAALAGMDESDGMSWAVLHRSAGWLALDCNQPRLAEQLACKALAGEPHPDIAEELRDLLEQSYFRRHLDLRGVVLTDSELQLSLAGPEVGAGMAEWGLVSPRIDNTARLIYRIAERKLNLTFRERGQTPASIRENHQMLVSAPRNGSFAVSLKFGSTAQPFLPGLYDTSAIIYEFMDLVGLVNRSRVDAIRGIIPDPAYLRNFLGLAKKLAPDGERIRQVGFTAVAGGKERSVELTTPAAELPLPSVAEPAPDFAKPEVIKGILRFADALKGDDKNSIQVLEDGRKRPTRVIVPPGMMNDIVRPMWDSRVVIQATRVGKTITLEDIQRDTAAE